MITGGFSVWPIICARPRADIFINSTVFRPVLPVPCFHWLFSFVDRPVSVCGDPPVCKRGSSKHRRNDGNERSFEKRGCLLAVISRKLFSARIASFAPETIDRYRNTLGNFPTVIPDDAWGKFPQANAGRPRTLTGISRKCSLTPAHRASPVAAATSARIGARRHPASLTRRDARGPSGKFPEGDRRVLPAACSPASNSTPGPVSVNQSDVHG